MQLESVVQGLHSSAVQLGLAAGCHPFFTAWLASNELAYCGVEQGLTLSSWSSTPASIDYYGWLLNLDPSEASQPLQQCVGRAGTKNLTAQWDAAHAAHLKLPMLATKWLAYWLLLAMPCGALMYAMEPCMCGFLSASTAFCNAAKSSGRHQG